MLKIVFITFIANLWFQLLMNMAICIKVTLKKHAFFFYKMQTFVNLLCTF